MISRCDGGHAKSLDGTYPMGLPRLPRTTENDFPNDWTGHLLVPTPNLRSTSSGRLAKVRRMRHACGEGIPIHYLIVPECRSSSTADTPASHSSWSSPLIGISSWTLSVTSFLCIPLESGLLQSLHDDLPSGRGLTRQICDIPKQQWPR